MPSFGPYADFIWPVYGVAALILGGMFLLTLRQLKRIKTRLKK